MSALRSIAALALSCAFVSGAWAAPAGQARLLRTIQNDDAYKVRMQAIRVLSKQLERSGEPAAAEVFQTLGQAAVDDGNALVRSMACYALGRLADERGRTFLVRASADSDPFVQKQAEQALERIMPPPPPPPPPPDVLLGGPMRLVVEVASAPSVVVPKALSGELLGLLSAGVQSRAGAGYVIGEGGGPGFHLTGTVTELAEEPYGAERRIRASVSITIATWPEKNLRHVVTAKAVASSGAQGGSFEKFRKKVLQAALDRAIQDTLAQLEGGGR